MNRHQFQLAAKKFRAGKLTLDEYTQQTYDLIAADENRAAQPQVPAFGLPQLAHLLARNPQSHKGNFGRCLLIGGSRNMPGAIAMAAMAAARAGAGLVTVATPASAQPSVANNCPVLMTEPLPEDEQGLVSGNLTRHLRERLGWSNVLSIGPGLGQSPHIAAGIGELLDYYRDPIVIDADGLNNLAKLLLEDGAAQNRTRLEHAILTPHEGEFNRLLGMPENTKHERSGLELKAQQFAAEKQCTIILKGWRTHVTDGKNHWTLDRPNPGLATAGSGDVLTGVVSALLAQGLNRWDACRFAVLWHAEAGLWATSHFGQVSTLATDVLSGLAPTLKAALPG